MAKTSRNAHALLAAAMLLALHPGAAPAQLQAQAQPAAAATAPPRDGSHDFDFEIGEWLTHLKRLQRPLSGSTAWVEYEGTSSVRGVLGGRANLVELVADGPAGRIEGASLRLYDPQAHQWTLNYFHLADGHLTAPMVGEFIDGKGMFRAQDSYKGQPILVRFVIARVNENVYRFEQAFSPDGGQTWETNWIATDTRLSSRSTGMRGRSL